MEQLRCIVERITYQNAENGYSVIKCRAKGFQDLVTVVGSMPDVHVGSVLSLGGNWRVDARYGRQFQMETFEETLPATVYGIEKYLGSGLVKGIGPKFAGRIVKKFGAETLNIIENEPDRLLGVEGIGYIRVKRIIESWAEQKEIRNIMLFLQSHDVSTSHATKIYKKYGNESIKVVQENPYRLADDIWGIGFRTADTIAGKLGFEKEAYARLRSGILYTLNKLSDEGHCYATRDMLLQTGSELLAVDESVLSMTIDEMVRAEDVLTENIPQDDRGPAAQNACIQTTSDRSTTTKSPAGRNPYVQSADQGAAARISDGRATANRNASSQIPSAQATAARNATGQSPSAQATADRNATGQIPAARATADRNATGQIPAARATADRNASGQIPAVRAAADRNASGQIPAVRAAADPAKAIYLPPFYYSETGTAARLQKINHSRGRIQVNPSGLEARIAQKTGMRYDDIQIQAILTAVRSKILILTGGPGTGKTTTTLGIITAFREAGAQIVLAAPTGRAAKRLSETTGLEAKTIHRLLEVKPPEGYQRNEEKPLEGDVLIVDECSMIDIMLMYNLLKAVPDQMTLIMVGDVDQLPSVGAGNVLRDIIDSGCFPVVRLTRIFRQAQTSRIIMNAHRINSGNIPDLSGGKQSDFFFIDAEKRAEKLGKDTGKSTEISEAAAGTIVTLVRKNLPQYYRVKPEDIQVLTPMQRGAAGAASLNMALQEAINPGSYGLRRGGYIFKPRDKVMQIRNNYDKEVFNGDIGVIESADTENRNLTVNFDGRRVEYDVTELDELVLAYATTIHKSQGSEYPIVVMPVLMSHYVMLQRNLIYTGITRAKKILVIVGTKKALSYAIRNVTVQKRNTMLKDRIRRHADQTRTPQSQTPQKDNPGKHI